MRKFIAFGPALVVLMTVLITLVAAPAAVRLVSYANTDAQVQQARQALTQDNILKQIDRVVRNIADAVEPSVVHIAVSANAGRRIVRSAQGSGWIFDDSGHIVTNAHVVRDANRIFVQFQDGRSVEADVVGKDPTTDIAVLKVRSVEGLVPIQRATGLELHQGDRAYAFGSPFGFKFSMSEGIVSGLGRDPQSIIGAEGYTNYIQTDAAVNPGNSGGPLVNVEGKLVGMNVAIATAARINPADPDANQGQSAGISFAIPLATIESVVGQIINGGVVVKGYLGITHAGDDDRNLAQLNQLGYRGTGVLATGVAPDGPAEKAGLQPGDIIVKMNGLNMLGVPSLRSAISNNLPGDKVKVEIIRDGELKTLEVTLGNLPPSPVEMREAAEIASRYGIADVEEATDGSVVVTQVRMPSPAYQAGIRPGQVVTDVQGKKVAGLRGFFAGLAENGLHQGRDVRLTLKQQDEESREIVISPK
jgi:serine protease Do